jgi:RimJ/RimL family protein N-acetyltransferase
MPQDIFSLQPVLENEHVSLRLLRADDYENLLPFSLHEPETWQFGLVTAAGAENLRNYIDTAIRNYEAGKEYPFIVFDKKQKRYAGSTRFYDIQQPWHTTQLGYTWYGKDFRRTGLNRHCKFLLLSFAFEQWGLERVEFRADINNKASVNAMKAIGCVEEGILRNHMITSTGAKRTSMVLSILREEWDNAIKQKLQSAIH